MTRLLTRRFLILSAALGTAALAACTSPTAPRGDDATTAELEDGGGIYGGSGNMCGGGIYGGSGNRC